MTPNTWILRKVGDHYEGVVTDALGCERLLRAGVRGFDEMGHFIAGTSAPGTMPADMRIAEVDGP
jgi:hypothetical protein